jgi:hypothetical protein
VKANAAKDVAALKVRLAAAKTRAAEGSDSAEKCLADFPCEARW